MNNKPSLSGQAADFLHQLGLNSQEIRVFQALSRSGPVSLLELSRLCGINRTTLYRVVEGMKTKSIVEEQVEEYRRKVVVAPPQIIEMLVKKEEERASFLTKNIRPFIDLLTGTAVKSQPGTKVLFYRGSDGIKQQCWNTLQAQKECMGFTYRMFEEIVSRKFALSWRDEWLKKPRYFYELYSDSLLESKKNPQVQPVTYASAFFQERYIPACVFNLNHQIDVYNDVVSIYNWHEGETFGIEIYNHKIADFYKQIFWVLWKMGKKI